MLILAPLSLNQTEINYNYLCLMDFRLNKDEVSRDRQAGQLVFVR